MVLNQIKYKIKTAKENEILLHLNECSNSFYPPLIERVNIKEYSKKLIDKSITFEAWDDQDLVGLIAVYFSENDKRSAFITNVSVKENYLGIGIASELLMMSIEFTKQKNFKVIELEVNKQSVKAIKMYKKFNFINYGIKNNNILMKLVII